MWTWIERWRWADDETNRPDDMDKRVNETLTTMMMIMTMDMTIKAGPQHGKRSDGVKKQEAACLYGETKG